MNDELQFGFSYAPAGLYTGANRILGDWLGGGGRRLSLGDYAVAHAVWKLDEILDSQDDTKPNAVESELVPAFIAATFKQPKLLGIAVAIGGSDIEQYLLRQNWRADPTELPWRQQVSFYGEEINGWLYLLANLQSPTGREFRRERSRLLMNMADNIRLDGIEDSGLLGQNPFGFLFLDKRLALEYWPRFKVRTVTHARGHDALKHQFRYLVNMEPLTTVEMYVEACRGYSYDHSPFQAALSVLDDLPDARRQEIISSLEREIQEDVSYIDGFPGDEADLQAYLLRHIKTSNWTDAMTARDIFENLRAGTDEYKPQGVADWLENAKPDHPLLKMLAEASEPELRLLVMGALKEHPTPANKQILEALLQDGNEQVRKAAQEVEAELTKLKETPAVQFAAGTDEIGR